MIETTQEVCQKADRHAAAVVDAHVAKLTAEGRNPSPEVLFALHRKAWASVTGADTVRVISKSS